MPTKKSTTRKVVKTFSIGENHFNKTVKQINVIEDDSSLTAIETRETNFEITTDGWLSIKEDENWIYLYIPEEIDTLEEAIAEWRKVNKHV